MLEEEEIKFVRKGIEISIPDKWNLHTNGKGNCIILSNPNDNQIVFRMDNVPYFCVSTILVYLTYQLSSFIKIHDVEVRDLNVDTHSNIHIIYEIKSGKRRFVGEVSVSEIENDIKLVGYLTPIEGKLDMSKALKLVGLKR